MSIELALDLECTSPAMVVALTKAQAEVGTVGHDKVNAQRGYKYASAEALIAAARKPLTANGFALVSTWTREPVTTPGGDIGNQFVVASVRLHFALLWSNGKEEGRVTGTAEMDAIGSRARPPDKAVAATLTYMRGFVIRELLNIDRGEDSEDIDQRADDYQHHQRETRREDPLQGLRDAVKSRWRQLQASTPSLTWSAVCEAASVPPREHTAYQLRRLNDYLKDELENAPETAEG